MDARVLQMVDQGYVAEVEGLLAFTRRQYTVAGAADPFYKVPLAGLRLGGGIAVHVF